MGKEQRMRFRGSVARVMGVAGVVGLLGGCFLLPDDGYEKVAYREREALPSAATPEPPPVVAGMGAGAGAVPQLPAGAPADVTQEMVEAGAQSFGTVCSACHGPGGAGTAAAPKLADNTWLHISGSFDEIVQIIHSGVPNPIESPAPMPPLGGGNFSDEQVRQIAAYVFALSHQGQ
jgi:mono/diheme cytochrome c family protein